MLARVRELTGGDGVDLVCEMSGHPSGHAQAFAAARLGGRVNLLGTPSRTTEVDFARDVIFKGLTLYGVTGRKMYETWDEMRRFLRAGQLDPRPVITHRFPLESIAEAIQVIKDGQAGKVILEVGGMSHAFEHRLETELEQFIRDGVYKRLNFLDSPQAARVTMEGRGEVIILSSNNYLGLSAQPEVVAAGKAALDRWGAGTASVRFICGTFTVHRALEAACARLVGTAASLSFVSAWNANEAVPATLLGEQDIVISDQLNHASIIDAARLAKAITKCQTAVYKHADLADLAAKLTAAQDRRTRLVITDGVFSMEGSIAPLPDLIELCRKHDAVLMVDDSHATGVLGEQRPRHGRAFRAGGRGGHHHVHARQGARRRGRGIRRRRRPRPCDYLTQRARPQLFSNALPPRWRPARSPASNISRPIPNGSPRSGPTRATSGNGSSSWASVPCPARRRSFRSSWARPRRRSG